jgi:hypothetical protein
MAGDRRGRRAAEEQFRIKTPSHETAAKSEEARTAEPAKTTRLRALRLAKEAANRDAQAESVAATRARVKLSPRTYGSILPGRADEVS